MARRLSRKPLFVVTLVAGPHTRVDVREKPPEEAALPGALGIFPSERPAREFADRLRKAVRGVEIAQSWPFAWIAHWCSWQPGVSIARVRVGRRKPHLVVRYGPAHDTLPAVEVVGCGDVVVPRRATIVRPKRKAPL